MKQLEVDLNLLKLNIKQLKDFRKFMDLSFTKDETEEEVNKTKLLKQSFEITISYLIFTRSMIRKSLRERNEDGSFK